MNNDLKQIQYEETLRRQNMQWQAQLDLILHSDRAAVDLGIGALKTAVLINAGSLVALLALIGQLWDKDKGHILVAHVLSASGYFVWGLVFGSIDFAVAYFYQSAVTKGMQIEQAKISTPDGETVPDITSTLRFTIIMKFMMALFGFISFGMFAWGILSVVGIFEKGI